MSGLAVAIPNRAAEGMIARRERIIHGCGWPGAGDPGTRAQVSRQRQLHTFSMTRCSLKMEGVLNSPSQPRGAFLCDASRRTS